jgi:hypothetical protein
LFQFFSPYSPFITRVRPSARKGMMRVARRIHLQFFLCVLKLLTNKLAGHLSIRINSDARVICTKAQKQYAVQSSLQTVLLGVSRSSGNRGTRQLQSNVLVAHLLPSMTSWRNWDCLVVSTRFTGKERKCFFVSKQNETVTKEQSNAFEYSESRAQQNRTAEEVSSDQRTRTLKRGGRRVLLPSIAGTVSNAERSWW